MSNEEYEAIDEIREGYLTLSCEELIEEKHRILSQDKINKLRLSIIDELLKDAVCDMEEDY